MTYIKDFKDLDLGTKAIALIILCQIPFFFVAIFLFKRKFIENISDNMFTDVKILVFNICLFLPVNYLVLFKLYLTLIVSFIMSKNLNNEHDDLKSIYVTTMVASILFLCASILTSYNLKFSFNTFLWTSYSFVIYRVLFSFFNFKKIQKNDQTKQTQMIELSKSTTEQSLEKDATLEKE
jgi:Na+-driven multidrug efflux pump